MGDIVQRKINLCLVAVMSILLLTAALLCARGIYEQLHLPNLSDVRTQVNELVNAIEQENPYNLHKYNFDTDYHYAVILADGKVAYDQGMNLHSKVNLHQLGSDESGYYAVPFLQDGKMGGMVYVELYPYFCGKNKAAVAGWCIAFLVIVMAAAGLGIAVLRTLKKDVFGPIGELHASTHQILYGQLDQPVAYDYDGEIGTLCHDFELMRTELSDGFKREQKLKDDEKLLMASISHDLKTPLTTVQGYLESICIGIVTEKEEVTEYCKSALNKTVLLSQMTNDILEHSKAELRQLSIEKEEVYSGNFFGEIVATLSNDANSRGLSLHSSEIPNLLMKLDPMRITQVMENIVGNSFKYCRRNGQIELSFSWKDSFFYVSVKDNGQGIEPEDLPFVFERFFRGDKARKTGIAGSGLGLSIAKYIVEQHGGEIACDSILGAWTEVRFSLLIS